MLSISLNSLASAVGVTMSVLFSFEQLAEIYLTVYNITYACVDLAVMVCAGQQLKTYLKAAFPGITTAKITRTLVIAAMCYVMRSLVELTFAILTKDHPSMMTAGYGIYWAGELVLFFTLTDLVFLAMLFKVIEQQSIHQDNIKLIHKSSTAINRLVDDSLCTSFMSL
jgi:uncharacterized membrane protein